MKKEDYFNYQFQYLKNDEHHLLGWEDSKSLHKLRTLNKKIDQHKQWLDQNQKMYNEYIETKKLVDVLIKEKKEVFSNVSLLKKTKFPRITIYLKDESSKLRKAAVAEKSPYTGRLALPKKREVYYCMVRSKTINYIYQKNIYLGSKEKIERILNTYFNEDSFSRSDVIIKTKAGVMLMDFFVLNLKNNPSRLDSATFSFQKVIIPWLKKQKKI